MPDWSCLQPSQKLQYFFEVMRTARAVDPYAQSDPTLDWIMQFIQDGPPSPSWSASPDQIKQFEYMFSHLPGYGDWVRARDNFNWMSDYLKNTGLDWSDMLYPSRNSGSGSGSDILNFTSSNIEKFYKAFH
nr:MAG: hypothetical protein [Smacoviridae sp.]